MKKFVLTFLLISGLGSLAYSQVSADAVFAMAGNHSAETDLNYSNTSFGDFGQPDGAVIFYPNPVKDVLNVRFPQKGMHTVRVFNIIGEKISERTVMDTEIVTINLSEVKRGMYFVSFEADGKIVTKTFSKQ